MTTRTRLSASMRREQLMAAAVNTLADRGFRRTTADEIASAAGVSKGLLWHYFEDLDDLLDATARQSLVVLAAAVASKIDLEGAAPAVIRSAIRAAAEVRITHAAERRAIREIVLNLRTESGELRFGMSDLNDLHSAQEAIFRRGQKSGDFRSDLDPRVLAVTYQGAVDAMLAYLDSDPRADADTYAEALADILLSGIAAGPAQRVSETSEARNCRT